MQHYCSIFRLHVWHQVTSNKGILVQYKFNHTAFKMQFSARQRCHPIALKIWFPRLKWQMLWPYSQIISPKRRGTVLFFLRLKLEICLNPNHYYNITLLLHIMVNNSQNIDRLIDWLLNQWSINKKQGW